MIICEIRYRDLFIKLFLVSFSLTLFFGFLSVSYLRSAYSGRIFLFLLAVILLSLAIFLNRFKRKIEILFTSFSIDFKYEITNQVSTDFKIDSIEFAKIKSYSISYPNNNLCAIKFVLPDRKFRMQVTNKRKFPNQSTIKDISSKIHESIYAYNKISDKTIPRKYSFFASQYGLYIILFFNCAVFIMLLYSINRKLIVFQIPYLLGMILLALAQRQKERNDFPLVKK